MYSQTPELDDNSSIIKSFWLDFGAKYNNADVNEVLKTAINVPKEYRFCSASY
jgi:hypothetical protein